MKCAGSYGRAACINIATYSYLCRTLVHCYLYSTLRKAHYAVYFQLLFCFLNFFTRNLIISVPIFIASNNIMKASKRCRMENAPTVVNGF